MGSSGSAAIVLSIVVPCFNAEHNSLRVQSRIRQLRDPRIEVILVDDGSSDGTLMALEAVARDAVVSVTVIPQANRGPGGARNTGLAAARGLYVWFVDCDDDFSEEAVAEIVELAPRNFDFIDFDLVGHVAPNTMSLPPGDYEVGADLDLMGHFGRLNTKAYSRSWWNQHNVRYPEFCLYEDAPLALILPFLTSSFHKSSIAGYEQHLEFSSITRAAITPQFFDRLFGAGWGFEQALSLCHRPADRAALTERFVELYVFYTFKNLRRLLLKPRTSLHVLVAQRDLSGLVREVLIRIDPRTPLQVAGISMRVFRQFRSLMRQLSVRFSLHQGAHVVLDVSGRQLFRFLWVVSFTLGPQTAYFDRVRKLAWNHPMETAEIILNGVTPAQ